MSRFRSTTCSSIALRRRCSQHPQLNAHLDGDEIVQFARADIGIAVATAAGLITPVVRDAAAKSPVEIARAIAELSERARRGRVASGRDIGRHIQHFKPGNVRTDPVRCNHQSAPGGNSGCGRCAGAGRCARRGACNRPDVDTDAVSGSSRGRRCSGGGVSRHTARDSRRMSAPRVSGLRWLLVGLHQPRLAAAGPRGQSGRPGLLDVEDVRELESRKFDSDPQKWPGAAVYRQSCSQCHQGQVPKAPQKMFLQMMAPSSILAALTTGLMKDQAASLTPAARRQVAEYLGGEKLDANRTIAQHRLPGCKLRCWEPRAPARSPRAVTRHRQRMVALGRQRAVEHQRPCKPISRNCRWHLAGGSTTPASHPAAVAKLTRNDIPRLQLKWAFEYPGAIRARSQPTIAFGNIYTGSQDGTVYALDLHTGCVRWASHTTAEVRTAIVVAPGGGRRTACTSGMSLPGCTLWMPRQARSSGTSRLTIIPTRRLRVLPRSRMTCCMCPSRPWK